MALSALLAEGFALGVSSGPVCLVSCSPVLLPVLAVQRKPARGSGGVLAEFLAGRLTGYLAFACLAWLVGLSIPLQSSWRSLLYGVADLGISVLLAAYGITLGRHPAEHCPAARARRFAPRFGKLAPVFLGFATGLSLCPPFLAAGVRAAETAGIAYSLLFFGSFFAGTSIWFAPSLGIVMLRRFGAVANVARMMLFALAGYYGYLALIVLGAWFLHG